MFAHLSYRVRLPLSLVATALFTTLVICLLMAWHTYRNVRIELVDNGSRLGYAVANAVQPALLHDDIWLAYSILRGPRSIQGNLDATLIVLDDERKIFASNKPRLLPVAVPLQEADPVLAKMLPADDKGPGGGELVDLDSLPDRLLLVSPIASDGVTVGLLLLVYPRQVLWPRFAAIVKEGGLSVLLVLAVIIPLGWLWGQRMVNPLARLAHCMVRVRDEAPENIECSVEEGDDEIGRLNARFRELLGGLREKAELERQMVSSERLAAVGRLAAGVAHEINNPLGGMLMAIDTLRERRITDPHTERTMSLLERGLIQIQDTVSALLVEARREPHSLTAQDVEDTRTLIATLVAKRELRMDWNNGVDGPLSLPSTQVRQVVINLLLNAVQSTPRGGRVAATFHQDYSDLVITIENDGEAMEQETLDHLFEPYYGRREGGSGLGLWVTYQIVRQLRGEIGVDSRDGVTCFRVTLPLLNIEASSHAA